MRHQRPHRAVGGKASEGRAVQMAPTAQRGHSGSDSWNFVSVEGLNECFILSQLSCWPSKAECRMGIFVFFLSSCKSCTSLYSCAQATELNHELRNALAERGRATTALHVLTTMQRHNVRISFRFSCEWCDGVMCGWTLRNGIS